MSRERPNAPPPKPRVGKSNLAITTTPAQAEVLVDGKSLGASDENGTLLVELAPNKSYKIEVKADDYEPKATVHKAVADKTAMLNLRLTAKFANLVLAGIPDKAILKLDGAPPPLDRMQIEDKQVTFLRIPTGAHKVSVEHPDYLPWEGAVDVLPDDPNGNVVTPPLVLALVKVTIEGNEGATVYVDDADRGTITPEGKLVIPNVRPGARTFRIVKEDFEEWTHTETLAVGEKSYKVDLTPIPSSAEFNDRFNAGLGKWTAPAAWSATKGLVVKGEGAGFPKDKNYRDFDMDFDLQLTNGRGAAWLLRARNGHAYIFYLSGASGKFPGEFRVYASPDGKVAPDKFAESQPVLTDLKPNIFYHVHIEARGNKISHLLVPSGGPDAGKEIPLGFFEDPQNAYRLGNVGFQTLFGEEFQINAFFIKPQDKK